ncbi:uncharacterized protein LOC126892409 [Diabrotica virgifera virgifera]|uniref:Uncharacterized protein n=1 Tax=Diabrotica virgifera virgifera TaxID=50390 RepID=A0ABM5L630_DIAVI|nr:uncharacterized protein LOC126892409 [Diabrotica virgifera virgifera]
MCKYFLLIFAVCVVAAAVAKTDEEDKLFDPYRLPKNEKEIQEFLFDHYKEIFTKYDESPEQKLQKIASFRANFNLLLDCHFKYKENVEAKKSCNIKYKLPDSLTEDDALNIFFVKRQNTEER